ncbi:MAG: polymerase subunit delta [Clostridia bacterium]|nr:polymerase subunit delta [Clostridia bacterium]
MSAYEQLRQAINNDKLAHAYLFIGGNENDRLKLAIYLAMSLNCQNNGNGNPCNRCQSCQQIIGGNHPDLHLLVPRGASIKIDQIRQLEMQLEFKSFQGGATVAVLQGADTMTDAAANSLLKTLEEPPERTYIVLLAEHPDLILPTIRSRCQELRLDQKEIEWSSEKAIYWQRLIQSTFEGIIQDILPDLEEEEDLLGTLHSMALACRDQLVWQLTGEEKLLLYPNKENLFSVELLPSQLLGCYQAIQKSLSALECNANRRLVLEVLAFDLARKLRRDI